MTKEKLRCYADIFTDVFRQPPWGETWSLAQAGKRIADLMETPGFYGLEYEAEGVVLAFIMGNGNQSYDGVHYEIKEFCVAASVQGQGIGGALLDAYMEALDKRGTAGAYLLTARSPQTEGFYAKRGFQTSGMMIVMGRA